MNIMASTKALMFKQLNEAKTRHYQYIKDIIATINIETSILPFLGELAWKSTEKILSVCKLHYWTNLFNQMRKVMFTKRKGKQYNVFQENIFDSNIKSKATPTLQNC